MQKYTTERKRHNKAQMKTFYERDKQNSIEGKRKNI